MDTKSEFIEIINELDKLNYDWESNGIKIIKDNLNDLSALEEFQISDIISKISYPKLDKRIRELGEVIKNSQSNTTVEGIMYLESEKIGNTIIDGVISSNSNIDCIYTVDTLNDYLSKLPTDEENASKYVFRGQDSTEYSIQPSAYREEYTADKLKNSIKEFTKIIGHYDNKISEKHYLERVAYAQHYYFPTNLLDFSMSPLIALLFALENTESKNDAVVYMIDTEMYAEKCQKLSETDIPLMKDNLEMILEGRALPSFVYSHTINKRIYAQKGLFMYFPLNYMFGEEQREQCEKTLINDCLVHDCMKVFVIKNLNRNAILQELFKLGISFESIYPELESAAKTLKIKNKFWR